MRSTFFVAALAFCTNAISTEALDVRSLSADLDSKSFDEFDTAFVQSDASTEADSDALSLIVSDRYTSSRGRSSRGRSRRAPQPNVNVLPYSEQVAKSHYTKLAKWTSNMADELEKFKNTNMRSFQSVVTKPDFRSCESLDSFMPRTEWREFRENLLTINGMG